MFDDEVVKAQLKTAAQRRQNVGWLISEMQKQIFEAQGIDGKFGIAFLGRVRELYGNDASVMEELMKFVNREELAMDEAEMPADQFIRKLEMKDWAMQQYGSMQAKMRNMTSDQQRQYMREQQTVMRAVQEEQKEIIAKAETLGPEEQRKYISEQVKKLQDRFKLEHSEYAGNGSGCNSCSDGVCSNMRPSMAPVMSQDEQLQFFKSLKNSRG